MSDVLRMDAIHLPPRTREILEKALHESQLLQALTQQNRQRIDELVAAARELLNVPEDWRLVDLATGFVPPEQEESR